MIFPLHRFVLVINNPDSDLYNQIHKAVFYGCVACYYWNGSIIKYSMPESLLFG